MFSATVAARGAATARAILGLREGHTYTTADVKRVYREKALTAHPDAGGDPDHFRQLQKAYEELLCELGAPRNTNSSSSSSSSSSSDGSTAAEGHGFGFYSHPHAQWANDRRSHRDYWQHVHDEETTMNSNPHGSFEHASNTHYRAPPHHASYGAGLGEEFASASRAQRGRHANFSTYYFYRPYVSDYRTPYGTGFTEEEIKQAAQEQRRGMFRSVARHTCLWSGMGLIIYLHQRNNRVRYATEAREKGYQDPEYWKRVKEEEAEARRTNRAPLRLEHHWLDAPIAPPKPLLDTAADDAGGAEGATGQTAARDAQRAMETRQRAVGPTRGAVRGGGPQVVSYKGRPFTPTGVRGARGAAPVTAATLARDVTYDESDRDWEEGDALE